MARTKVAADQVTDRQEPDNEQNVPEKFYRDLGDQRIDVDEIRESAINPRQYFDLRELHKLAASIKEHGQLQNATVRMVDEGFELISGARRYRAVKKAELTHLNCRVIECDDRTAIELRGMENYARRDFNPVEEAIWFRQMIDDAGYNQTTLAEKLDISPGQVSNRLRLLKLPEEWQQKIVFGDLPGTHARSLVPWAERQSVLDAVAQKYDGRKIADISVNTFEVDLTNVVLNLTKSMDPTSSQGPKFELTEEIVAALDVVEVAEYAGAKKTAPRAFNVDLWTEHQADAKQLLPAALPAAKVNDEPAHKTVEAGDTTTSEPTRQADISRLTDYAVEVHTVGIYGRVLSEHLRVDGLTLRIFLARIASGEAGYDFLMGLAKGLDRELDEHPSDVQIHQATENVTVKGLPGIATECVRDWLVKEPSKHFSLALLCAVAEEMALDPMKKWQPNEELLELCSESQLRELFTEEMADPKKLAKWGRDRLVKELLQHWPEGYLPALLTPSAMIAS